ncbi:MAG: lipoyl(octanoyl) transferase LipB [Deltaproteobacteria bacterium]|nr:lipoyl(octanoyl) transferase LipB [Deltaproteobacteria bacterium]
MGSTPELPGAPAPPPLPEVIEGRWLGRQKFDPVLARQHSAREALVAGTGPSTILLVEHVPTLTLGRRGERQDVLWSAEVLNARGIDVCETPRGGQVTLHAPGQLVAYPIIRIGWRVREHIVRLGRVAQRLFAELGVRDAEFRLEHPGVWVGPHKIASIGVHVSRGVTLQGIAMNLAVDPTLFGALVSCGMQDPVMRNAADFGARPIALPDAATRWAELFVEDLGVPLRWAAEFGVVG